MCRSEVALVLYPAPAASLDTDMSGLDMILLLGMTVSHERWVSELQCEKHGDVAVVVVVDVAVAVAVAVAESRMRASLLGDDVVSDKSRRRGCARLCVQVETWILDDGEYLSAVCRDGKNDIYCVQCLMFFVSS